MKRMLGGDVRLKQQMCIPFGLYYCRSNKMDKDKQKQWNRNRFNELFNSIAEKVKPEN